MFNHPQRDDHAMHDDAHDEFTDRSFSFSTSAHCRSFSMPLDHLVNDRSSLTNTAGVATNSHVPESFRRTDHTEENERDLLMSCMGFPSRCISEEYGNLFLDQRLWRPAEDLFYNGVILPLHREYNLTDCYQEPDSHSYNGKEDQLAGGQSEHPVMKPGFQHSAKQPNPRDCRVRMARKSMSSLSSSSTSSSTGSSLTSASSSSPSSPPPSLRSRAAAVPSSIRMRPSSPISYWHKSLRVLSKPLFLLWVHGSGGKSNNTNTKSTILSDDRAVYGDAKGLSFSMFFKGCKAHCMQPGTVKSSIYPVKTLYKQGHPGDSALANVGTNSPSEAYAATDRAQAQFSAINHDHAALIAGKRCRRDQDHSLNGIKGAIAYCKQSQAK